MRLCHMCDSIICSFAKYCFCFFVSCFCCCCWVFFWLLILFFVFFFFLQNIVILLLIDNFLYYILISFNITIIKCFASDVLEARTKNFKDHFILYQIRERKKKMEANMQIQVVYFLHYTLTSDV